jgi:hypothetical protein
MMFRFLSFLTEAARTSSFSDEHAFAHVWNHSVQKGKMNVEADIEAAKKNPKHPLSFETYVAKHGSKGFKSGTDLGSSQAREHYNSQIQHAAQTVSGMASHRDFKAAHESGHLASVAGAAKNATLSDTWKKHGATDTTSRADIHIGDTKNPSGIRVSYKHYGGSQLASAQSKQTAATIEHAANQLHKTDTSFTKQKHQQVIGHLDELKKGMQAVRNAKNDQERDVHLAHVTAIHKKILGIHPGLANHIAREAATGQGQFGPNSQHSATHVVSNYNPKTKQTAVKRADEVTSNDVKMRMAKGKGMSGGKYRELTMRMDYK